MTFLELLKVKLERKKNLITLSSMTEFEDIIAFFEKDKCDKEGISEQEFLAIFLESYEEYCDELVVNRKVLSIKGVDGAPNWYRYEYKIWDANFKYIEPILKVKKFKGKEKLTDGLLSICLSNKYGKGRQSLIILIGEYGLKTCASSLGPLLDDSEVTIQVIAALTKMKDVSQYEKIKVLAEKEKATPERFYAKKYVNKVKKDSSHG
ncbi:hypothetical protein HBP80_08600 [Listeria welshimeri]|nr:hypothetical protein [Listeria welshimeri]